MCVRQGDKLCSFLSKDKNCARLKWDHDESKEIPGIGLMISGCQDFLHSIHFVLMDCIYNATLNALVSMSCNSANEPTQHLPPTQTYHSNASNDPQATC